MIIYREQNVLLFGEKYGAFAHCAACFWGGIKAVG
jgi:hypothetical protein